MADVVSTWVLATFKAGVDRYRSVTELKRKSKDRLRLIRTEVKLAAKRGRTYRSSRYKAPNYRCPIKAYKHLIELVGLFSDRDLERIVDFYAMIDDFNRSLQNVHDALDLDDKRRQAQRTEVKAAHVQEMSHSVLAALESKISKLG